jgi:hypothetical protein
VASIQACGLAPSQSALHPGWLWIGAMSRCLRGHHRPGAPPCRARQPLDGEAAKRRAPTCTADREDAAAAIELEQHAAVDNAIDKLLHPFLYNVTGVHLACSLFEVLFMRKPRTPSTCSMLCSWDRGALEHHQPTSSMPGTSTSRAPRRLPW